MVPKERIELPTYRLQGDCTTAVLFGQFKYIRLFAHESQHQDQENLTPPDPPSPPLP
jgi:hypothetical protein